MTAVSAESQTLTALNASSDLVALVARRFYFQVAPQGSKLPLIVFERTTSDPTSTIHDGAPVATKVTLSVSAWSKAGDQAVAVADLITAAMHDAGEPVNRLSHYDEVTEMHATFVDFEIWELGTTNEDG